MQGSPGDSKASHGTPWHTKACPGCSVHRNVPRHTKTCRGAPRRTQAAVGNRSAIRRTQAAVGNRSAYLRSAYLPSAYLPSAYLDLTAPLPRPYLDPTLGIYQGQALRTLTQSSSGFESLSIDLRSHNTNPFFYYLFRPLAAARSDSRLGPGPIQTL